MSRPQQRKLTAILFADIEGYTALMQTNEPQALAALQKFKTELEQQVPQHQGELIQFYGDGCLVTFHSSVDAVACAKQLQITFQRAPTVPVRIGLHAGDIVFKDDNVFGDAVNIASRVESMGIPGAVLLSSTVRNQIKNQPSFDLVNLGRFEFKNVEEGMTIYALKDDQLMIPQKELLKGKLKVPTQKSTSIFITGLLGLLLTLTGFYLYNKYGNRHQQPTKSIKKSIAVLPFKNDSPDGNNIYFCNGIMDGILNHLAKIPELTVVPRTSVEPYRKTLLPLQEIAKELGVNYLVEGSVQKEGEQVLVFAQLSSLHSDGYVWSEQYDKELKDIFSVQADITKSIAKELQTIISPTLTARIEHTPTKDQIAYDYFLQGNEYLFTVNSTKQSGEEWNAALNKASLFYINSLKRDSLLAEAYVRLAQVEYIKRIHTSTLEEKNLDTLLVLTNKALAINPSLAEAHVALGRYYLAIGKQSLARYEFDEALKLKPSDIPILTNTLEIILYNDFNYIEGCKILKELETRVNTQEDLKNLHIGYYHLYRQIGDLEKEALYSEKVNSHSDFWYNIKVNRLEDALLALNALIKVENQMKLNYLGLIHLQKRDFEKALAYYTKWEKLVVAENANSWDSANNWHRYGQALIKNGQLKKGQAIMQRQIKYYLKQIEANKAAIGVYYDLAGSYAFLGDKENAYFWLERFVREEGWLKQGDLETFIQHDISFDNLREDQQFQQIVQQGSLEKTKIRRQVQACLQQQVLLD